MPSSQAVEIAVVGDVHGHWDHQDALALKALGVDLVLFVGDFGNEAVALVQEIAALALPMAVALGNHDAWYSATEWGLKKCPYDRTQEDWVQKQLDLLGDAHVGYGGRHFPELNLSVVGGRPFSWGGPDWRQQPFYQERFQVHSLAESAARIIEAIDRTHTNTVIFLSHNGPSGLGDHPEAPCGKDWHPIGGDFGDPDLRAAITAAQARGKVVPLVAFGHMHHRLRHTQAQQRQRLHQDASGTLYLNAACVPRHQANGDGEMRRNFTLVTLHQGQVQSVRLVWLSPTHTLAHQEWLFQAQDRIYAHTLHRTP